MLKVNHASIAYKTGDFRDIGLKEWTMRHLTGNYHVEKFMAVNDVSFELMEGDMLGIIGSNGSGKSTLLKAVSGIMTPSQGSIEINGKVAALLELGSGFDGDLTVKENAYLRGAMLGYTKEFMDVTYDEIIAFSELQDFQERAFKQLSSGMQSRLAFSIASLVKPDILILDEVLSVGDGGFQEKSAAKMREIIGKGATTILVSHSQAQIRELCNKVLWLDHGRQIAFGETAEICDLYEKYLRTGVLPENTVSPLELPQAKHQPKEAKKHEYNMDFARVFSILMVMLIHVVEIVYGTGEWVPQLNGISSTIYSGFKILGRVAVPIFLMLTGYFLLDRDYDSSQQCKIFYKRKFIPIVIVCELWIVIFWWIQRMLFVNKLWFGAKQSIITLLEYLFLYDRNAWQISWYIPILMVIYLFIPFLAKGLSNLKLRYVMIPVAFFWLQDIIFWTINNFFSTFFPGNQNMIFQCLASTVFRFRFDSQGLIGVYISFAIVGLALRRGLLKRVCTGILLISISLLFVLSVIWLHGMFIRDGLQYTIWYEWLPIDLLAVAIFELFRRATVLNRKNKGIIWISKRGLGYFFIHGIVLNLLAAYSSIQTGSYTLNVLLYWLCTFAGSTIIIFLLSQFSLLSKALMATGTHILKD